VTGAREDTIVALATGPVPSALALIRVSGLAARSAVRHLLRTDLPAKRTARLRRLFDVSGALIDEGVVTTFPGPDSFTGEDLVEVTVHGGPAVVEHLIDALTCQPRVRLAEPGEFTRRAFEAGRLDLTEAEAIADLIAAETQSQKAQALEQLSGRLTHHINDLKHGLIEAMAAIELMIDFADEGDAPDDNRDVIANRLVMLSQRIRQILDDNRAGERIREGVRIAIIGPPNAGKSTLLNALAGEDAAIVSMLPGTTRDVVSVRLILGGVPVTLLDTAGLRVTEDVIEAEGVTRARRAAETADLKLLMLPADAPVSEDFEEWLVQPDVVVLRSKSDLLRGGDISGLRLSVQTGENFDRLRQSLDDRVRALVSSREPALITRRRHREAFELAVAAIDRAMAGLHSGLEIALVAEDIRAAAQQMERLLGRLDVEDVLGAIFSRFCIGK